MKILLIVLLWLALGVMVMQIMRFADDEDKNERNV